MLVALVYRLRIQALVRPVFLNADFFMTIRMVFKTIRVARQQITVFSTVGTIICNFSDNEHDASHHYNWMLKIHQQQPQRCYNMAIIHPRVRKSTLKTGESEQQQDTPYILAKSHHCRTCSVAKLCLSSYRFRMGLGEQYKKYFLLRLKFS